MNKLPTPQEIEALATQANLSIMEMCRRASVAPSTFHRWKGGETSPSLEVVQKMLDAVTPATKAEEPAQAVA